MGFGSIPMLEAQALLNPVLFLNPVDGAINWMVKRLHHIEMLLVEVVSPKEKNTMQKDSKVQQKFQGYFILNYLHRITE